MRKTLSILALVAAPQLAMADDKMELGVFAGAHFWNDNNELGVRDGAANDRLDPSLTFGVRLSRRLAGFLTAEGELAISPASTHTNNVDVVALGYRLQALVHPTPRGRLQPFVLIGFGGSTSASADTTVIKNDTDLVGQVGVGLKYKAGESWGLRFDARAILPPSNEDSGITYDGELLLGVYKTFGAKPKPAPAPAPTETPPPAEPKPETCPPCEQAATPPDPDPDRDGFVGAGDACPDKPETVNNYQDTDGCPDEVPAQVKQFTGVISGVEFATGSDGLAPGSTTVLDGAVTALRDHPTLRVEISGHSDTSGDAAKNRELSRRRAEAVKTYLVSKGIAANRLEAVGFGPDKPIADNATPEGRAKNRRVEFRIIP
jgi:outer membrane protein OmpA-like peptidoglycan-associated protein